LKRILSALALLLTTLFANGQAHHEFGLTAGVSNYYGDLQSKWFPAQGYNALAGVSYKYFATPRLGFRFGAAYTRLTAADSLSDIQVHRERNLSFGTGLFEVHTGLEINLLGVDVGRSRFSPYVFGGVAVFFHNPYTSDSMGNRVFLRPLSTEGQGLSQYPDRKEYSLVNVSFPVGGGLKFFVGKTLMITTELGFRYCTTDYLDDVSKSYVNLDTLMAYRGAQSVQYSFRGDEIAGWREKDIRNPDYKYQRGDSKSNDWYWFGSLNVAIYFEAFGNLGRYIQAKCPRFLR
jgi:hypothetical protein